MAYGATAWGRHARCRREKSKRSDMWFSGARVDRSASVLGQKTPTARGHRDTLSSNASVRTQGSAEWLTAEVENRLRLLHGQDRRWEETELIARIMRKTDRSSIYKAPVNGRGGRGHDEE